MVKESLVRYRLKWFGTNGTNYYIYAWYGSGGDGKQNAAFDTLTSANESIKAEFKLKKGYHIQVLLL